MAGSTIAQAFKPEELEAAVKQAFGEHPDDVLAPMMAGNDYLKQIREVVYFISETARNADYTNTERISNLAATADLLLDHCGGILSTATRDYSRRLHNCGAMSAETFADYQIV